MNHASAFIVTVISFHFPSESVLKKRLLDTSIGLGSQMSDMDFESLLELAVKCGVAAVEGKAPQRIIYPGCAHTTEEGDVSGQASMRKFECADFFQPTQRLTVDQTRELLTFLQHERPEVDRGRFGFARMLSQCLIVGTEIRQNDGRPIAVEDVTVDTQLLGSNGRQVRMTQSPKRWYCDEIYTIHHENGTQYSVSAHHQVTVMCIRPDIWKTLEALHQLPSSTFTSVSGDSIGEIPAWQFFQLQHLLLGLTPIVSGCRCQTSNRFSSPTLVSVGITHLSRHQKGSYVISIEVDGDHRYQLKDGTLTHNSAPMTIKTLPHGVLVEVRAKDAQRNGLYVIEQMVKNVV